MSLRLLFAALSLMLLVACPEGDDDDSDRTIPPPEECNFPSLSNVSFTFTIHLDGEDYPQNELLGLMEEFQVLNFPFQFYPAVITELGPDPDSNRLAVTLTDATPPAEGEDPPEDPNYVRIVYELPLGYELPVELGDSVASVTVLDITTGDLIAAFGLWEELEDGSYQLLFLAEPSDAGLAFQPGPFHPVLQSIAARDRQCPNLTTFQCASTYNLSLQVEVRPDTPPEGEDEVPGEAFEVWPTQHHDFVRDGLELRLVNVWSFTHREIDPDCSSSYDWAAERFSFFVTRTAAAPPD